MDNPYKFFPKESFWRPSITERNMLEITDMWTSKHEIMQNHTVATAGSCFAQHISRAMIRNGFNWIDAEPMPRGNRFLSAEVSKNFGYGVFSFRTGNIYTAALLRQWVEAAFGVKPLDEELWEKDSRIFDPMRPAIEPDGFVSADECKALRRHSLAAMRKVLSEVDLFVFTLGLTESWRNKRTGFVYAACPGTLAGTYSEAEHEFYNQTYPDILADMKAVLDLIRQHNPSVKFLLTVSPVPLVATAEQKHVLVSTTYSKSVLRAVAGDLSTQRADTDYFPSFEIINSPPFRGSFFMPNQREVSNAGVNFVMGHFFAGLGLTPTDRKPSDQKRESSSDGREMSRVVGEDNEIQCEEALLEAFSK